MARILSVINLKGGVGKTHTAVALAETFSAHHRKNVLVIDLDPQTNATVMLIGEHRWRELNEQGRTLAPLFEDALNPDNARFDLEQTLQRQVSDVQEAETVDLIPSSLDLIDIQEKLVMMPPGRFRDHHPTDVLRRGIQAKLDSYDVVIIDCPPNLGFITLNGLRLSQAYVIPTIPDILSTYGIPQIVKHIREFSRSIDRNIEPLGVLVSKYRHQSKVHQETLRALCREKLVPCFRTVVPEANHIAAAAERVQGKRTIKQKYGHQGVPELYRELADEIWAKL